MQLQVRGVTHTYGDRGRLWRTNTSPPVLSNISLSIEEGQCLGLLGTSGAGKSTLGKIILGLQKPTQGQVLFQNQEIYKLNSRTRRLVRRDVQAVFQNSYAAVNPRTTAEQIIGEPLDNYERLSPQEQKKMIGELLERVGLKPEDMRKYPHQFSGGQLQRINIARAIALKPKLIVLDEPVSSLDMINQTLILTLLNDLKTDFGLSYLFITHDIKAAYSVSDHLAVMEKGQVVEIYNEKDGIFASSHPTVTYLLASMLSEHPKHRSIHGAR
ncbi:nickel import ATP-binding protein NikE [Paenibacillus sp. YIM B09110]|uniref:nickel import ATP-binding protein NikE n=1 Tax=Paenibacillus sp. YIM B09110 TaxID=3126102 RepID=UPI00301D7292